MDLLNLCRQHFNPAALPAHVATIAVRAPEQEQIDVIPLVPLCGPASGGGDDCAEDLGSALTLVEAGADEDVDNAASSFVDGWRRTMWQGQVRYVKYIDGKRVISTQPKLPMSRTEAIGRAREAKAHQEKTILKDLVACSVKSIGDCYEHARVPKMSRVVTKHCNKDMDNMGSKFVSQLLDKINAASSQLGKRSDAGRAWMSLPQIQAIANDPQSLDNAAEANNHNCSRRQIGRVLSSWAYSVQLVQAVLMQIILARCRQRPPAYCCAFPIWDETKERMKFTVDGRNMRIAMEIFVFKLRMVWGYDDGSPPEMIDFVIPPISISSTTERFILQRYKCKTNVKNNTYV